MPECHEMKKGEVYVCEGCGLELQVVKECQGECKSDDKCACTMSCCGKELVKKGA